MVLSRDVERRAEAPLSRNYVPGNFSIEQDLAAFKSSTPKLTAAQSFIDTTLGTPVIDGLEFTSITGTLQQSDVASALSDPVRLAELMVQRALAANNEREAQLENDTKVDPPATVPAPESPATVPPPQSEVRPVPSPVGLRRQESTIPTPAPVEHLQQSPILRALLANRLNVGRTEETNTEQIPPGNPTLAAADRFGDRTGRRDSSADSVEPPIELITPLFQLGSKARYDLPGVSADLAQDVQVRMEEDAQNNRRIRLTLGRGSNERTLFLEPPAQLNSSDRLTARVSPTRNGVTVAIERQS